MEFLTLNKIFAANYYAVPDYQRDYEWTNSQNSVLVDDVFSLISDNNEKHFIGAIVTIPFEKNDATTLSIDLEDYEIEESKVKHIVDGQQRLTSLSVFCKALLDTLDNDNTIEDTQKIQQKKRIINILEGQDFHKTTFNSAPRLMLNSNTGYCYNKEILKQADTPCNKGYRGAKRLLVAYDLFTKEINSKKAELINDLVCSDALDFYKKLIKVVTDKIQFVEIECDKSYNAFQVFDSLNGKGLDLTAADRIKNIMLSWSPPGKGLQKWESIVSEVGEDYLANFFVSLFFYINAKRISKNKLPDQFRNTYKSAADDNYDNFYNKLKEDATIYGQLRKANTSNKKLNNALSDLIDLSFEQVFVILFAVAKRYSQDILNTDEYIELTKNVTNLIVRMQVCEKSTNRLDTIFGKYINQMHDGITLLSGINKQLKDEVGNMASDDEFRASFSLFAPSDNKVSAYYLRKLEALKRKKAGKRTNVEKGLTVEHIIPQTLDDLTVWYGDTPIPDEIKNDFTGLVIERIGNKALLYGDDNSSANNNVYLEKIQVYKNGKQGQTEGTPYETFELIKEVVDDYPSVFNHTEVDERAKKLTELAIEIWS